MSVAVALETRAARSTPATATRPARAGLVACLLLALVARLGGLVTVNHPELRQGKLWLTSDEPTFHDPARALAETGRYDDEPGGAPTAYRPPGLVLPLAALYRFVSPSPFVGLAFVLLTSLVLVAAIHRLAWITWHDPRAAAAAGLMAAVLPTLAFTGSGIWSEPQAVLLTILVLLLLVRGPGSTSRSWATIGMLAALAYLTRPSAVFFFPFLFVGAWHAGRLRLVAVLAVALGLPIAAWGVRNQLVFGEFLTGTTVAGEALWGSNNPVTAGLSLPVLETRDGFDLHAEAHEGHYLGSWVPMIYIPGWTAMAPEGTSELEIYHQQVAATRAFVRSEPLAWLRLLGYKLRRFATVDSYAPSVIHDTGLRRLLHRIVAVVEHWSILVLGFAGLFALARADRRAAGWYGAFLVAGLAIVLVTYPNPRFLLPFTAVLVPLAGRTLARAMP